MSPVTLINYLVWHKLIISHHIHLSKLTNGLNEVSRWQWMMTGLSLITWFFLHLIVRALSHWDVPLPPTPPPRGDSPSGLVDFLLFHMLCQSQFSWMCSPWKLGMSALPQPPDSCMIKAEHLPGYTDGWAANRCHDMYACCAPKYTFSWFCCYLNVGQGPIKLAIN